MMDEDLTKIRTHRNNIARYLRLLQSEVSGSERTFLQGRLEEERVALNALAAKTFPLILEKTNQLSAAA